MSAARSPSLLPRWGPCCYTPSISSRRTSPPRQGRLWPTPCPSGRLVLEMLPLPGSPRPPRPRSGRTTRALCVSVSAEQVASFLSWISKSLRYPPTNIAHGHGRALAWLERDESLLVVSMETGARVQQGTGNAPWGPSSVGTPDRGPLELSKRAWLRGLGATRREPDREAGPPESRPGRSLLSSR